MKVNPLSILPVPENKSWLLNFIVTCSKMKPPKVDFAYRDGTQKVKTSEWQLRGFCFGLAVRYRFLSNHLQI